MFSLSPPAFALWLGCVALTAALTLGSGELVEAQPTPPSTFFGKATAPDGEVAGGLDVLAYVDGVVCSEEEPQQTIRTELEGELVTSYLVRVLSSQQKEGCGEDGDEVRLQIGGRFAEQTEPGAASRRSWTSHCRQRRPRERSQRNRSSPR